MSVDIFSFFQGAYIFLKERGKVTRFTFAPTPMFNIEKTLKDYGVLVYGRRLHGDGYRSFLVKNAQARWAEELCFRANFPKIGTHFSQNEKYRGAGLPARQWEKGGRKGDSFYWFANLYGKILDWLKF